MLTGREFKRYRNQWRRAYAAFGGFRGAGGWISDLVLSFDVGWNVDTGEVGPTRWFITEMLPCTPEAVEMREIQMPDGISVCRAYDLLRAAGLRALHGDAPCRVLDKRANGKRLLVRQYRAKMIYARLADVPIKEMKKNARMKFCYHDNPFRTRFEKIEPRDLRPSVPLISESRDKHLDPVQMELLLAA